MDTNRDIENFKSYSDGLTERIKLNTGEVFTNERGLEERVAACEIAISNLEDDTLKKDKNLNDVQAKQTSLSNLESSASTPASADDYGYDTTTQQSKSNVQVQTTWGGGIPMAVPFKDFADTVIDTSANPLPISKGGTNAQDENNAINNLLGNNTTSVLDTAVRDDGVIPYRCDSAYAQGSNFGKVSLSQLWSWERSIKGVATLEDVNSITAKYITSSASGAAFSDEAALAGNKYYAGQIITTSTSPALGNNDYCIVLDSGSAHNNATARYVYQSGVWVFQYVISQVILSQAQLDALNSGITNSKVSAYDGYATNKLSVSENLHDLNDASTAIENLCYDSSSVDAANAIKDTTKIPVSDTSASIPNRSGHTTLLDIFNNWLKDKLQNWLGITVTESGGSITGRSFSGEAATVASITSVTKGVYQVPPQQQQTGVTYTVTFSIPTGEIFIGYRFNISDLGGGTLNIESSYKVTRNQIIVSVKYDFTYGGYYPTITTVAMFCGQ